MGLVGTGLRLVERAAALAQGACSGLGVAATADAA